MVRAPRLLSGRPMLEAHSRLQFLHFWSAPCFSVFDPQDKLELQGSLLLQLERLSDLAGTTQFKNYRAGI